ncbi:hypothetical protein IUY40_17375, partial [Flavobacterium sp. ALJ2]|nr:hypothetical protein [Flavobacterium sp. ALJ2]
MFLILGGFTAYGQVGVGTLSPNESSQLDVVARDRGVLIPRVKLIRTDRTEPIFVASGTSLPSSLLVFNEAVDGVAPFDVKPGYYYWFNRKWNRIVVSDEITSSKGTVIFNPITNKFSYINESGHSVPIDIKDIVKANETLTSLDYDRNTNTLTYKAESGPSKEFNLKELVGEATSVSNTLDGSKLTTKVNGVASDALDLKGVLTSATTNKLHLKE